MLVALMTDIHGNREAFEACLEDATARGAGRYVFLGDYVGYGPDPGFVVDTVRAHVAAGALALMGNHDEAALGGDEGMNALARAAIAWTRQRLDPGQLEFLAGLPLTLTEGEFLYVHANAWAPGGWDYVTSSIEAERSLRRCRARATFCGHVHVCAVYQMAPGRPPTAFRPVPAVAIPLLGNRRWLAVIGAVGQPRDGDPAACYALLEPERGTLTYIRVPYDVEATAAKIRAAGLPSRLASRLVEGH